MLKKILISILLIIFLLEFFSFIATKLNLLIVNHDPDYIYNQGNKWRIETTKWGSWHKPNFYDKHSTKCFKTTYNSNNIGARDNIDYNKELKKDSIVLLGDSFAEGFGVNYDEIFPQQLEKKINRKVLNFGSSAHFGPLQSAILYENLAINYPHNEIIFFFLPQNDFVDNNWEHWKIKVRKFRNRPYFIKGIGVDEFNVYYPNSKNNYFILELKELIFYSIQPFLTKYTYTANTLRTFNSVYSNFLTRNDKKNISFSKDSYSYFIEDDFAVKGTMFSIEKLLKLTLDKNRKIILIIPSIDDLKRIHDGENYKNLLWYKMITNLSYKYSAELIDMADYLTVEDYKKMIFKCDDHWNSYGHSYTSNLIFENIYK